MIGSTTLDTLTAAIGPHHVGIRLATGKGRSARGDRGWIWAPDWRLWSYGRCGSDRREGVSARPQGQTAEGCRQSPCSNTCPRSRDTQVPSPRDLFPRDLGLVGGGASLSRASPGAPRESLRELVTTGGRWPVRLRSGLECCPLPPPLRPQAARELTPEVPVFFRHGTELAPDVAQ